LIFRLSFLQQIAAFHWWWQPISHTAWNSQYSLSGRLFIFNISHYSVSFSSLS
jgi:hypothetical protein